MLREYTHRKIEQEAKSDSSMHENYIHVLVAKMIVNEIFNDHEAQLKQAYIDGSNSCNELIQSLYKQIEQLKDK